MKPLPKLASAFAILSLALATAPAQAEISGFKVNRAINIAQRFTWPRYDEAGSGIQWPPFKEPTRASDAEEFRALREAGFDSVRLPVDPAPFIVFNGQRREEVYGMLFDTIAAMNAAGLNVIIDIHPNSRHAVWGQHAVIAGLDAPAFKAVADVIGEMARRLKPLNSTVALELLNEPRLTCNGSQQQLWQKMAEHLAERARAVNPQLTLVVTGACVGALEGLLALDPKPFGEGTIFTFHYYEPFSFTHQGAQFIPWPDKYLDGVPWPAASRPISEPATLLEQQVDGVKDMNALERLAAKTRAKHNLKKYYAKKPDAGLIDARFREVAGWARMNDIATDRIFLGEFGVVRREPGKPGAFCEDRARWHRDITKTAAVYGFSWAYFSYDGPFGLQVEDGKPGLDPITLAALGLKSACLGISFMDQPADPAANSAGTKSCVQRCQNSASMR
jgi:endoglucanase